jgi:hypothetical protein
MIQGNTASKEGENIDPETRSPPKNKQKINAPALKPSTMTVAVSEKSIHTKNNKHVYKYSRIIVKASIKLLNDNPFQEFIVAPKIYSRMASLLTRSLHLVQLRQEVLRRRSISGWVSLSI